MDNAASPENNSAVPRPDQPAASPPPSVFLDSATPVIPGNKKNAMIPVIMLIVVLLLSGAGYIYWKQQMSNQSPSPGDTVIIPSNTPAPGGPSAQIVISPRPITPMPENAPATENEFYLQIGSSLKGVFK